VTITGAGMALSLVLGDILGPAMSPIPGAPGAFAVAVSPAPQASAQRDYSVTVTNTLTGAPVDQADVSLHNFTATGTAQTFGPRKTNAAGQPATFTTALNPKVTYQVNPITHERRRIFAPPTLTVSKTGFTTINLRLLEDTGDV
jgi:hypothetical protein